MTAVMLGRRGWQLRRRLAGVGLLTTAGGVALEMVGIDQIWTYVWATEWMVRPPRLCCMVVGGGDAEALDSSDLSSSVASPSPPSVAMW